METPKHRPINVIAQEINRDWKRISVHAKPHLGAMMALTDMESKYYADSAPSIIAYFLSNAAGYRGPNAKRLKDELRTMLREWEKAKGW